MADARETGSIDMGVAQFGDHGDRENSLDGGEFKVNEVEQVRDNGGFEEEAERENEPGSKDSVQKGNSVALSHSHKDSFNENQEGI